MPLPLAALCLLAGLATALEGNLQAPIPIPIAISRAERPRRVALTIRQIVLPITLIARIAERARRVAHAPHALLVLLVQ